MLPFKGLDFDLYEDESEEESLSFQEEDMGALDFHELERAALISASRLLSGLRDEEGPASFAVEDWSGMARRPEVFRCMGRTEEFMKPATAPVMD